MGLYNAKMKTFAIIVLLAAVKTLNSSAGIKFNIPGDNFNIPNQGRQTHYPEDNIPELKFCRPEAPCQYSEGDCTRHGDDGCHSDLVCGVNNCGDFVPGMAGSCCAQLAGPSIFREEKLLLSYLCLWSGLLIM